ncbi:Gas vesicle synthesis protein GvpL/GvpF [Actinomadura meyerae]|uniref:Gas vesicle synthesis protein GvpL/GvpF n=1 Tax=Actinomadura meyerae TaxID=240840 RepID=A0A239ISI2_9ACTN|nr:GvpL/GvpF family gas vesicle protein [Actinomadura meyerae]SNS96600.1 Gas vesicle synthesis protein GvpL/GvpF [Actinomadura meyerae]
MTGTTRTQATATAGGAGGDSAVYLYGVARGLDPAALGGAAGVGGAPVRGIAAAGLTALVSTVALAEYGEAALRANLEDLAWLEATARAHHDVVDLAARTAPTAPVRIATIYRDDDRVAEVLAAQGERFAEILDLVSGRSEWGVKAYADPEAMRAGDDADGQGTDGRGGGTDPGGGLEPTAESLTGPQPAAGAAPSAGAGKAYLMRRQRERRRRADAGRRAAEQAAAVHAELADHAVASRHHPPQDPRLSGRTGTQILNAAYLLDEEQAQGFLAVARAAGDRLPGIEVEVTGPWPPYSFIEAAAPAAPSRTEPGDA